MATSTPSSTFNDAEFLFESRLTLSALRSTTSPSKTVKSHPPAFLQLCLATSSVFPFKEAHSASTPISLHASLPPSSPLEASRSPTGSSTIETLSTRPISHIIRKSISSTWKDASPLSATSLNQIAHTSPLPESILPSPVTVRSQLEDDPFLRDDISCSLDKDDAATESDSSITPIVLPKLKLNTLQATRTSSKTHEHVSAKKVTIIPPIVVQQTFLPRSPLRSVSNVSREDKKETSKMKRKRSSSPTQIKPQVEKKRVGKPRKSVVSVKTGTSVHKVRKTSTMGLSPRSSASSKDLVGPLIQVLALSGKSSMTASSIIDEVLSTAPALRTERTPEEWKRLAMITLAGNPMFGKAERSGLKVGALPLLCLCVLISFDQNADDEAVPDEWFYRPEKDTDKERRATLEVFQRGGGKRRATLEKKQYYWKPVV